MMSCLAFVVLFAFNSSSVLASRNAARKTTNHHIDKVLTSDTGASSRSKKIRIAWVGNSQCFYNDLPGIVKAMMHELGVESEYEAVLVGGQSLIKHAKAPQVQKMLAKRNFDFVVLQDATNNPGGSKPEIIAQTEEALLNDFLPAIPEPTQILLYTTAAQKYGTTHTDERDLAAYPDFVTMQTKTIEGYKYFHTLTGHQTRRVPYGDFLLRVFSEARDAYEGDPYADGSPFNEFHLSDNMHPTRTGSYAAACLFTRAFIGISPENLTYTPTGSSFDKKLKAAYMLGTSKVWPRKFKEELREYIEKTAKSVMDEME